MKTQKFLMSLAAIAALSMSSCTQEEELLVSNNNSFDDPNAVLFGTYASQAPQSRGAEMNIAALQTSGFGVYAYYTGTEDFAIDGTNAVEPNFMSNQLVTWDKDAKYPGNDGESVAPGMWSYSPVKYWPNNLDEKVSFFAYAPYTSTEDADKAKHGITSVPENTTTGDPKIKYVLSDKPAEQIDLLYSGDMLNLSKQNINQKVTFKFSHAMSRIGFKRVIEVDEVNQDGDNKYDYDSPEYAIADGSKVVITKVSLSSTDFYKSGTLNLRTGNWEDLNKATQVYTLTESDFGDGMTADKTNSQTATQLNAENKYLMIFPTDKDKKIPIDITVEYNVITKDENLHGENSQITSQVTSHFDFEFAKGKFYNFVLHIGLTSVKLEAETYAWNRIWDRDEDKELEGEVVVNTPNNNSVSLIYDANGGKFINGSSRYIVTAPVPTTESQKSGDAGVDFEVRYFSSDEIICPKDDGDDSEYEFNGWTEEPLGKEVTDESQKDENGEYVIPVYIGGETITVSRTNKGASCTIYAWWPIQDTVL